MVIPMGTDVRIRGNDIIFTIDEKVTVTGEDKYRLIEHGNTARHSTVVSVFDLLITGNRELYKELLAYQIECKKKAVKELNNDVKIFKSSILELGKFSSDEEELNDLIDTFKTASSSALQKLLTLKEHINFKKFLDEWV